MPTPPVFSTREGRNPDSRYVRNIYNRLLTSIRSGHSFRIIYRNTENAGYSFPVDNVEISADDSEVGAMALWHIGQELVTSPDRYEFQVKLNYNITKHDIRVQLLLKSILHE